MLKVLVFFLILQFIHVQNLMAEKETFLYFGYGSNLLASRIHIQNPSAVRNGSGLLKGYGLDFYDDSELWGGAVATIVSNPDREVWGAIWEMDVKNLASLDRQEGVHLNKYVPFNVTVETPEGETKTCRCYKLVDNPPPLGPNNEFTKEPSKTYLSVIITGAKETGLPEEYLNKLKQIKSNGRQAVPQLLKALEGQLNDSVAVELW